MADDDKDLIDSVKDGISTLFKDERSPDQKILAARDRKQKNFKLHRNAYLVVNGGFLMMAAVLFLSYGWIWPFVVAAFPALAWGMGFTLHGLSYRSWIKERTQQILDAERRLGRLPPGVAYKALPKPKNAPVIEGVTISDPEWITLLAKAEQALARAHQTLDGVDQQATTTEELRINLNDGLDNIKHLAAGAERISEALTEIAPDGGGALNEEIAALDVKMENAATELRQVLESNRAMLLTRKEKLKSLEGERARMLANAEGFLLAAENVRLDLASLGSHEAPSATALDEPAQRLNEEVEIMRRVEAELKHFM